MSRCFPYPPPGYVLSRDLKEALIESIKLQEEKRKRKEKKEDKRKRKLKEEEEKRKKKERKERRERRKHKKNQNLDKSDHNGQTICTDKTEFLYKIREPEAEQEQSSLTEEHGDNVSFPGPTSSSNRTQNSNKRKRPSSPKDHNHGQSKFILIRMPSKKQNEFDTLVKEQQACSTSERTDDSFQESKGKNGIRSSLPNGVLSSMQIMEMQYKDLLDKLVPLDLQDECLYSDNLDWLFKNQQDMQAGKRQRSGSNGISSCSRSSEFLHETGLFVLPYTIPY